MENLIVAAIYTTDHQRNKKIDKTKKMLSFCMKHAPLFQAKLIIVTILQLVIQVRLWQELLKSKKDSAIAPGKQDFTPFSASSTSAMSVSVLGV